MTLLETLPGVHRWCCTWCGREADRLAVAIASLGALAQACRYGELGELS